MLRTFPTRAFMDNGTPHATVTYRRLMHAVDSPGITYLPAAARTPSSAAAPPAAARRPVPCLACLHHRTPFMSSSYGTLEGRPVPVLLIRAFALGPSPSARAISRADLRAPPASH